MTQLPRIRDVEAVARRRLAEPHTTTYSVHVPRASGESGGRSVVEIDGTECEARRSAT